MATFHPPCDAPFDESHPRSARVAAGRGERRARTRRSGAMLGRSFGGLGSTDFSTLRSFPMSTSHLATALVAPFEQLRMADVESVGGINASLGEMISQLAASGVRVPGGFATTAHAFREFLQHTGLAGKIEARLATLNT